MRLSAPNLQSANSAKLISQERRCPITLSAALKQLRVGSAIICSLVISSMNMRVVSAQKLKNVTTAKTSFPKTSMKITFASIAQKLFQVFQLTLSQLTLLHTMTWLKRTLKSFRKRTPRLWSKMTTSNQTTSETLPIESKRGRTVKKV